MHNWNERTWAGDKPEIGAVLGMRMEFLDKKVSFRQFLEKMNEYILIELKNPNDVLSVVRDEEDPRVLFRNQQFT